MLIGNQSQFLTVAFDSEAEIEGVVADNFELLFGQHAVFIAQRQVQTDGGRATVPDAIVIDLADRKWFVVEVERGHHGTWAHIAPQISKQLTALRTEATRERILKLAIDVVHSSPDLRDALTALGVEEMRLHGRIAEILKSDPIVAIPIDEVPADLEEWARTLRNQVKIWQIEKFIESSTGEILYSLPDDAATVIDTGLADGAAVSETKSAGGRHFQELLSANLLAPGDELFMDYAPRGQEKKRFQAVVRDDGLEVEGRVYSPSNAALACIRSAKSSRTSANGWTYWKTAGGELIDELYRRIPE